MLKREKGKADLENSEVVAPAPPPAMFSLDIFFLFPMLEQNMSYVIFFLFPMLEQNRNNVIFFLFPMLEQNIIPRSHARTEHNSSFPC
jgi:hypothetical protein